MDGMTPADIRAITDRDGYGCYGDGMFGGNGLWFLALLFLFGNGGFGNWGGRGAPVTEAELCSSQSFSELKNQVGRLNDQQAAIARQTDNAICQIGYQNLQNTSTLASQLAACCCDTARNIDSVKFDMANYAAATNAHVSEQTQKVLDAITGNRMADMQNQINQLQLQAALCGIPRTNPYGYGIYAYPACSGVNYGCNTCSNI